MAVIMTRECGFGVPQNNYLKITGLSLCQNEGNFFLKIDVKMFLSKESRDYDKMKDYIRKNKLLSDPKTEKQIQFLNTYWNKPEVLSVGEATLSFPVSLKDVSHKTQEEIMSIAYIALVENRGALGYKTYDPSNILENSMESLETFVSRVVTPFLTEYNRLGE